MSAYPPEKAGVPGSNTLPVRSTTLNSSGSKDTAGAGYISDEDAVPDATPSDTTGLLLERLQAWKHACGYLENYVTATEKLQKEQSKEYGRVLKSISDPLKEGHHFDQELGGIAGLFENMRSNTQALANSHLETSKSIDGQVLPILQRLHKEIKNKHSELSSGAGKAAKAVDAAKNNSQKRIESLGQHTAAYDSAAGVSKQDAHNDPYVLQRGIRHMLHRQVLEENNSRQDLVSVQQNFAVFEAHVVQTFQQAFQQLNNYVGGRAERERNVYADILGNVQHIDPGFEWSRFQHRQGGMLVDPNAPKRDVSHIAYPNQEHFSTKPLIAGTLERKSRATGVLTGYKTGFYAVTPAKFLHQFESEDDFRKDPSPELSLYLPDCTVGAVSETKFNVKGKDASKGKVGSAFQMSHEISFKAHTHADAVQWRDVIARVATGTNEMPPESTVASPVTPTAGGAGFGGPVGAGAGAGAGVGVGAGAGLEKQGIVPHSQAPPPVQTQGLPHTGTGLGSAGTVPGSAGGVGAPTAGAGTVASPTAVQAGQTSGTVEHEAGVGAPAAPKYA